ncbi:hypothetical protein [Kordia zhangzhouensis]|nr:hypothetical protein [Kordia zhangzhouensis]
MKKRNVLSLQLNKKQVSNLQATYVKGGGPTAMTCNTVPRDQGGLGCHLN